MLMRKNEKTQCIDLLIEQGALRKMFKNIYNDCYMFLCKPKLKKEIFQQLPSELIQYILVYAGLFSFHRGKYIKRIDKTDYRYKLLRTLPYIKISNYTDTWLGEEYQTFEIRVNFSNGNLLIVDGSWIRAFGCVRYLYYSYNKKNLDQPGEGIRQINYHYKD